MLGGGRRARNDVRGHRGHELPSRRMQPMTATLATLRKTRRVSQLELSLRAGVSQRHLSCIETGRARAGRATLIALLDALGATLEERNQALLAAGYAPAHTERSLDAPEMEPVRRALTQLLEANGPTTPTMVMDGEYNLVMLNEGVLRLMALLGLPDEMLKQQPLNLLRVIFAPGGLRTLCVDEAWLCAEMWARASREAEHLPRLRALLDELQPELQPWTEVETGNLPVLAFRMRAQDGRILSFFSAITSFGTPLDITLASLKVEHLFPTDEATRAALAAVGAGTA
jgi:transcriptional regulator with XRE-family HTH domain